MVLLIKAPAIIKAAGTKTKLIEEFFGRFSTSQAAVSIARMKSPPEWTEPGQTPEFDEYTLVLSGSLRVKTKDGTVDVEANQAILSPRGQWVQYSTPAGAEYISVCLPAFSPGTVHRDI
jgi:ethanolamine utilization protein EutQ (cupin superfamily)